MARTEIVANLRGLRDLPRRVDAEVWHEIRLIALDLLGEAIRRAPVKEGILRGSGSAHFDGQRLATGAEFGQPHPQATPAAGGQDTGPLSAAVIFNTVYAAAQHERNDYAHPKGGEAKYLERPLAENRAQYERHIAAAVQRGSGAS
jgi:hypothetical protein